MHMYQKIYRGFAKVKLGSYSKNGLLVTATASASATSNISLEYANMIAKIKAKKKAYKVLKKEILIINQTINNSCNNNIEFYNIPNNINLYNITTKTNLISNNYCSVNLPSSILEGTIIRFVNLSNDPIPIYTINNYLIYNTLYLPESGDKMIFVNVNSMAVFILIKNKKNNSWAWLVSIS